MDISIILPIYNVEKYLSCCIQSLINQTFNGEYEIICINDGSTDNSLEIIKTYKKKNPRIKIINQENKGLSAARNIGIKHSNGKYLMFVDSDDYLKHSKVLENMYDQSEIYNLDIIIGDFEYDFEDKYKNYRKKRSEFIKNTVMSGKRFYELGIKTDSIMSVVWNKLYRKDFIINNNLYFLEGILYEDMEFTPRAYYLAGKVKYMDEVIYMYRQREGSIMNNKFNGNRIKDYFIIADSLSKFNNEFKSQTLNNAELYIYVIIIRKLKCIKDKYFLNDCKLNLKNRNVVSKFLNSNRLKYKVFIMLYIFKIMI